MKNTTTKGDATLEGWRRELATTNLEQVKRPQPVEQWVTAAGMPALDALLCSVAYGSSLTIEARGVLCSGQSGSSWVAKMESPTGARYAEVESDNLAKAVVELAKKWARQ